MPTGDDPPRVRGDLSLLGAGEIILRRPRWVLLYPALLAAVAVALTFIVPPRYSATVEFAPERLAASGAPSSLAGLAGEFGLNVLTDVGRSPAYYVTVLQSRRLKEEVLQARVTPDSLPVLAHLRVKGRTAAQRLAAGVKTLNRVSNIRDDPRTGIIRISVETHRGDLSAGIAMRYVEALNRFNTTQRQSQARERRRFLESRIATAERGMRDAEDRLRRFYQTNPRWASTPVLMMEATSLRTGIDAARDAYLTLQREYELARLEEISDTPVLTVIDPAVAPLERSWPRRKVVFAGVLVIGALAGVLAAFTADYLARARIANPETYARLTRLVRPWRR